MTFNPEAYAPGDIVEIRQTCKVVDNHIWLKVRDVKSGELIVFTSGKDTTRVTMVKRAARRKPKTREILIGAEVGQAKWKRGSVIRCTLAHGLSALVLFADGKWHDIEGVSAYGFDDLSPEAPFEVLLVA